MRGRERKRESEMDKERNTREAEWGAEGRGATGGRYWLPWKCQEKGRKRTKKTRAWEKPSLPFDRGDTKWTSSHVRTLQQPSWVFASFTPGKGIYRWRYIHTWMRVCVYVFGIARKYLVLKKTVTTKKLAPQILSSRFGRRNFHVFATAKPARASFLFYLPILKSVTLRHRQLRQESVLSVDAICCFMLGYFDECLLGKPYFPRYIRIRAQASS